MRMASLRISAATLCLRFRTRVWRKIGAPGTVVSIGEGVTRIAVNRGKLSAEAALIVTQAKPKSWQFESDIAPIFSKLGCNNNACHGALNGQSGFKLSLFGYDAPADYDAVVKHSDGRRIDRAQPGKEPASCRSRLSASRTAAAS